MRRTVFRQLIIIITRDGISWRKVDDAGSGHCHQIICAFHLDWLLALSPPAKYLAENTQREEIKVSRGIEVEGWEGQTRTSLLLYHHHYEQQHHHLHQHLHHHHILLLHLPIPLKKGSGSTPVAVPHVSLPADQPIIYYLSLGQS